MAANGLNPCFVGMWSFSYQQFFASRGIPSLNPCFVGMWSFRELVEVRQLAMRSLNPCFVGMWSFSTASRYDASKCRSVLILVLLGCGLLGVKVARCKSGSEVLILVLLGCGLLGNETGETRLAKFGGLNPCFVGMWSFRKKAEEEED